LALSCYCFGGNRVDLTCDGAAIVDEVLPSITVEVGSGHQGRCVTALLAYEQEVEVKEAVVAIDISSEVCRTIDCCVSEEERTVASGCILAARCLDCAVDV
jgi:hypothetical protein